MPTTLAARPSRDRLSRIAAQIERLEANTAEWAESPPNSQPAERKPSRDHESGIFEKSKISPDYPTSQWENGSIHANLSYWRGTLNRLVLDMKEQSRHPFSLRTLQIAALCAFVPFVLAVLSAAIRFMPQMPSMSLWSKITWFMAFPIFLSMTGAFVGFLIGLMLDTFETQMHPPHSIKTSSGEASPQRVDAPSSQVMKSAVWVAVEDLEPNQRVAETVIGENGTPILLRHTLLKPNHLELLKKQNIRKVKVEVMKYSSEGDLALVG